MSPHSDSTPRLSLPWKFASCLLIAGFLLLGLIGLVLPVIPGILFLFLAVLLATRISRRAAAWAEQKHWFTRNRKLWHGAGRLTMMERFRLTGLVAARSLLKGLDAALSLLRKPRTPG